MPQPRNATMTPHPDDDSYARFNPLEHHLAVSAYHCVTITVCYTAIATLRALLPLFPHCEHYYHYCEQYYCHTYYYCPYCEHYHCHTYC